MKEEQWIEEEQWRRLALNSFFKFIAIVMLVGSYVLILVIGIVKDIDMESSFVKVGQTQTAGSQIVYHKETKVMYVVSDDIFTLLVDADGKPMLWEIKDN